MPTKFPESICGANPRLVSVESVKLLQSLSREIRERGELTHQDISELASSVQKDQHLLARDYKALEEADPPSTNPYDIILLMTCIIAGMAATESR